MANMYINAMTALWNSSGTTYSAIKMNVTNAASAASSMLIQLQTGSVDRFYVDKNGNAVLAGTVSSVGITSSASVKPSANDSAALGVSDTAWSDLYLASGGTVNFNAGDVTLVHSANTLTFTGAGSGYLFDAVVKPSANDNATLGASGVAWSDLYLASGAAIDWAAGDLTLTHSADVLTLTGGDLRVATAGTTSTSVATLGGTQTLTGKTLTTPNITTPTITGPATWSGGGTLAGTFTGGTFVGTTLSAPTITSPTISNPTVTGTSSTGVVSASGAISSGGNITANNSFIGSSTVAVLATAGAGTIYLRPNGSGDTTGQITVSSSGSLYSLSTIRATSIVYIGASSGNVHLYFGGAGDVTRAIIYTAAASQGVLYFNVGAQYYYMDASGNFLAPNRLYAYNGNTFLETNGNIYGSVWTNLGYSDAYTAIVNRIEDRAIAWANNRVASMSYQKVSLGYYGVSGGFSNLGGGTVIVGYSREGGGTGQVAGLYYMTLQVYDPVRGWVSFAG